MERTDEIVQQGTVRAFSNNDVVRYIREIVVYEDHLEVLFKAGIEVSIPDA